MTQTLAHTFNFQTPDTSQEHGSLENSLSITEEDDNKHYIQFMQYWTERIDNKTTMYSREIDIKVDRSYYLEIANITIDNRARRRHLFSILGRRRLGANSKNVDYSLISKDFNIQKLHETYEKISKEIILNYTHVERSKSSINSFKSFIMEVDEKYIVYLEQLNSKKRKKFKKSYFVELTKSDYKYYKSITVEQKKVNYIFNKIGKIYFKSLEINSSIVNEKDNSVTELANLKLKKTNSEMEVAAGINNNHVFRTLKNKFEKIEDAYFNLYSKTHEMMQHHDDENSIHLFSVAVIKFAIETKDLKEFEEIITYLTTIQMLAKSGTLSYLFIQNDLDFRDIFLYMLESLIVWNSHLISSTENIREFNISTIDLRDALRHLVDMSFAFKHDYQCKEIKKENNNKENKEIIKIKKQNNLKALRITSAEEYFMEIDIDIDSYDELYELELEISELQFVNKYDVGLNNLLIKFFHGYTYVLNPLFEFKDLSYSLMVLAQKLEELEFKENNEMLLTLVKGLVSDLLVWKQAVLVEKTAEDIHYMNKSFYSNISQIEILMEDSNEEFIDASDIFFDS